MATLVFFHAHPDDEAIATGGTMARAADEGHRVVAVYGTKGEHGEVPDGFLDPGEELWQRREQETRLAAGILGVKRVEFLGYTDSGMVGTPTNEVPGSFWRAEVDEAAGRLAAILREEEAEVLTVYDADGTYGHPDHIQVHRVGVRAAQMVGTPRVYESVIDRDRMMGLAEMADRAGMVESLAEMEWPDPEELATLGVPGHLVTTNVDVTSYLSQKRAAMAAHASQISETSFFLALPPELAVHVWGLESYTRRGAPPGTQETWLL